MQQQFYAIRKSYAATLVLLLLSTASILRGQTLYIGANNGDWATPTNWNNGAPSATNPPTVTGGAIVNINGTVTIDYAVQNFGTIINVGITNLSTNLTTTPISTGSLSSGGALENRGSLTVETGCSVTSSGGMLNSGTFNNSGNVNSNSAWTNAATGILNNSATFMQLAPMTNDGTINNGAGLFTSPQAITNNNIIDNKVGAKWVVDFGGSYQNLVGSTLTNAGTFQNLGIFTNNTTVTNSGTFNNNGNHVCTGTFNNESSGLLESTGTFNLTGRVNNKVGASVKTSFRFNVLALGYVANFASFTNNDQVSIELNGTFSNETGATMPLGAGSKVLNAGYLKFALNSSTSGSGEINNANSFDNYGSIISAGGGKVINSGTLTNYGIIKDANILDNSGIWNNTGTIENNNGAQFTNTGTIENRIGGKIINNYDIFNKPTSTFTNNGTLTNNVRFTNEGGFTNNAYLLNIGDFLNKTGSTFTNNEVIENREGAIVNEGTLTNNKSFINLNCAVFSNRAALGNTGRIENSGVVFQKGTLTGNAIVALTGWIQNGISSVAAICRPSLRAGTDVVGEAKVYGQNPVLPTLGIDECAAFQYAVDNQTRAVYLCSKVGQTFTVPFRLLTRTNDSLTCTIPITVFDGVPPLIANCPSDINILTDQNTATHSWTTITATDNCTPNATIVSTKASGSAFNLGTTEVVVTASDANGNNGDCRFKVTVQKIVSTGICAATDATAPIFTGCPANITVAASNGGRVVAWNTPSVSDACLPITLTANATAGQFFPAGTHTVTYTAKDSKGNTGTCSFTITVTSSADLCLTDAVKPVIRNCPANVFATTNSTIAGAVAIWRAPSATDNCGFVNLTSTANSGATFPIGTTNVTYTATDAKNNTATCLFTVTVAATNPCAGDVTAPALTCPTNVVVNTTTATAIATWTVPTPTDACAGGVTLNGTHTPNSTFAFDTTLVSYTATDRVGNRSTCTFAVVVKNACFSDTTRPVMTACPADITKVQVGGSATATWTAPTATDNCSTAIVFSNFQSGVAFPIGTTAVVYTAIDERGNANVCKFNVVIQVAPIATCTGNTLLNPSFESNFTEWFTTDVTTVSITNDATSGANAASLCGDNKPVLSKLVSLVGGTYTASVQAKVVGAPTTAFVGIEFYDAAGVVIPAARLTRPVTLTTYSTINFTFTKPAAASNFAFIANKTGAAGCILVDDVCITNPCTNDVTAPSFTGCPANITVNGTGTVTTGIGTWTAPVATDNCSTPAVVSNFNSGQSFPIGVTTVTYTATDSRGLTGTCSFTVTYVNPCVNDVTPPSFGFTCPSNRTSVSSNGACVVYGFNAPKATDNCSIPPTVTSTYVNGFCFPIGVTPITYTATDASNNKATCTFTVTVTGTAANSCAASGSTGGITREFFQLTATTFASPVVVPTTAPTTTTILGSFEAPQNVADNYVQRIRGFLRPTVSGNYTFYVTGDDNSDLYLSTSTDPAAKTRIAFLNGFTLNNELTKYPSQKSVIIALIAGQNYYIEGVHQEGGGGDNLAVYWVVPNATTPALIPGANLVPFCQNLAICTTPTNLALNKPATQSSDAYGGTANKAVDGNTEGNFNIAIGTHTACGNQDWWQVDLGSVANITQVKLWNRTDCCADRLNNSFLIVSNTPFSTNDLTTLRNTAGVFVINIATVALNATIDVNRTGRYVRVQLGGAGCLSLAEVQVFGCASAPVSTCSGGLQATYYNNKTLSGTPVLSRIDPTVNFDWGTGSPAAAVTADNFSVRWTGQLFAPVTGTYTFTATVDDGFRLWVGGVLLIDKWFDQAPTTYTQVATLTAGSTYDIRMEYYENGGVATAKTSWSYTGVPTQPIPSTYLCSNPCSIAGSVLYERWNNYVNTVWTLPILVPTTAPSISQTQGNTQGTWNIADNYMTRVRGYIKPTTTGVYSFNVTGDDNTELYLSPSSSSASMTRIASITGWTLQNENGKFASQTSANITLTAGQLYYFEMRQVEGGGGDGWNVFWKTPTNATWQIIQAQNLARPCFNNVFAATSKDVFTFEARADVNQAKLQWISNGGDKNDYYEVEHLNEAGTFEKIGTINAATRTTESESFSFTDANPLDGDNSYRIKTVENKGFVKLSDIKTVTFATTDGVRLFPNPANDYVDIDVKKYNGLQVTITVYNQFGKIVQTAQIEKASSAPFHLEFGDVATGSYLIRVQAQGKKEVMRKLQIAK